MALLESVCIHTEKDSSKRETFAGFIPKFLILKAND